MGLFAADGVEPIEWLAAGDAVKLQCVTGHWGNQNNNWVGIDGDGDNSVRCVCRLCFACFPGPCRRSARKNSPFCKVVNRDVLSVQDRLLLQQRPN